MTSIRERMGFRPKSVAKLDDTSTGATLKETGNWFHNWDIQTPGDSDIKEIITLQFASDGERTVLLNKNVTNYTGSGEGKGSAGESLNNMFKKTAIIMDKYGTNINRKALPAALGQATARMAIIQPQEISKSEEIMAAASNLQDKNAHRGHSGIISAERKFAGVDAASAGRRGHSGSFGGKKMKTSKSNEIVKRRRRTLKH